MVLRPDREEIGVVARSRGSSSNSNSSSNSSSSSNNSSNSISDNRAALVVAVEDPEVGVALGGAGRLQGKSFAMAAVELAMSLPTAQRLQQL